MTENKQPFDEVLIARKKFLIVVAFGVVLIAVWKGASGVVSSWPFAKPDDATHATLPILGAKGVGKQSFIDFSSHACSAGGSGHRFKPPASKSGFYDACGFHLFQTMTAGYADKVTSNRSRADLIKFLKKFQKQEFYPPLFLVDRTPSISDKKWLNTLRTVFPEYVVAFRVPSGEEFDQDLVAHQLFGLGPIAIFPLRSGGAAHGATIYAKDVLTILDYYRENLQPSRNVNLHANVFTNETIRIPLPKPETKTQVREHSEPRTKRIRRTEVGERKTLYETGRCLYPEVEETISTLDELGLYPEWVSRLVDSMSKETLFGDLLGVPCVPETKEETIVYENKISEKYRYETVREYQDVLERDVVEVWHGLADGSSFFLGKETSAWRVVGTKLLQEEETQPVLSNDED